MDNRFTIKGGTFDRSLLLKWPNTFQVTCSRSVWVLSQSQQATGSARSPRPRRPQTTRGLPSRPSARDGQLLQLPLGLISKYPLETKYILVRVLNNHSSPSRWRWSESTPPYRSTKTKCAQRTWLAHSPSYKLRSQPQLRPRWQLPCSRSHRFSISA